MQNTATDIIIISYNSAEFNFQCIESINNTKNDLNIGIILVDNASVDNSVKVVSENFPDVTIIKNEKNLGYAAAVNIGVKSSNADFIIIANSDVIFHENSIQHLVEQLEKSPNLGACGPQQVFPDGSWQASYGDFPGIATGIKDLFFIKALNHSVHKIKWKITRKFRFARDVDYIDGAVMAINKQAFDSVGGFDEEYFFYTEEADFCYRLKKDGWIIIFYPDALVTHYRGGSSENKGINPKSIELLVNTKVLFTHKHTNSLFRNIYIRSEYLYFLNLLYIRKLQERLSRKRDLDNIITGLEYFVKYWKRALEGIK